MFSVIHKIFQDKDYREILFKSSHFLIFRLLGFLIAYGFSFFVIKNFGEAIYGYVALGLTLFSILVVFGKVGFDIHLTKKLSAYDSVEKGLSYYFPSVLIAFIYSSVFSCVIYVFAEPISVYFFNKPEFATYLKWTILSVPLWTIILINSGVLRGLKQNGLFSFINFFSRFFVTLIILLLIVTFSEMDGTMIMKYHFYAIVLILIFSSLIIYRLSVKSTVISKLSDAKNYIIETIPLMSSTYFYVLLLWSDKIILGVFETEVNIGVYDIITKIAVIITFTYEALNSILAPKISDAFHRNDMSLLQRNVTFSVRTTFITSIMVFIGVMIFHKWVLEFLGEVYLSGVFSLMVLCIGKLIISMFGPVSDILQMTGHQKVYSRIMFITLIVNLILNYTLIKSMGINGAATATSIAFVLMFLMCFLYIRKRLKINSFIV